MVTKLCDCCQKQFPATAEYFYRHRGARDGLQGVCRVCVNARRDARRKKNLPAFAEKQRQWRSNISAEKRESERARARRWFAENRERALGSAKQRRDTVRAEMIAAYGGKCECCGESESAFLTIDHVNGGGRLHRLSVNAGGNGVMFDLRRRGWPKDEYRLLCYNCNCGRARNGGVCPHEIARSFRCEEVA